MPSRQPTFSGVLTRLSMPAFLFSLTLFLGTVALAVLFNPGRFPVSIGDAFIRLDDLESEYAALKARAVSLEAEAKSLQDIVPTPALHALASLRDKRLPTYEATQAVHRAHAVFALPSGNPVSFSRIHVQESGAITLTGTVRDASGRSMQLLASFVDELRDTDAFASVSEPEYREQPGNDGISETPFTLKLQVAP